jgi:acyl-coenzyme A synthetase/AMP-(fatty) acid ligase
MELKDMSLPFDNLVSTIMVDLSNSYGIIDQVHLPFAMGATVVTIPFGFLNPLYYNAISTYRVSFFFSVSSMFDRWLKLPEDTPFDFSSLKFVALGGTAVSTAEKKRYHEFLERYGGKDIAILNGYGLSELGGACALSSPDLDDETIGYPMPEIIVKLYDENNERYFTPDGNGGEGVLYMTADSIATPKLDGEDVVEVEYIEGEPYVCTNDLVRVDPDGRITYLGRANRFFMREEGRKYESGKVETEFSRLEDIGACAIVPVYYKVAHETLPMLCVETLEGAGEPMDIVKKALCQVFIEQKTLTEDDVPSRVMLTESLPRNVNGKIDLYQINQGKVSGDIYTVEPVRTKDRLSDFNLIAFEDDPENIVDQVMDTITTDFKNNMPGNNLMRNIKEGKPLMGPIDPFEYFDSMRHMHQQMMNNMQGMMGQWLPWGNWFMPFGQMR